MKVPTYIRSLFTRKTKSVSKNKNKEKLKKYLKKYLYVDQMAITPVHYAPHNNIPDNPIWTMWWKNTPPEIIQMCLDSIKRIYPNAIIISNENFSQYIEIPDHIIDKHKQGIISDAHLSDWIRVSLLERYGGTWIDASCLMLARIPHFIMKQSFFILQNSNKKDVSNFFIHAEKNNHLIRTMRIFLEEYWKSENTAIDYLFFHYFFITLCENSTTCKQIFMSQIPYPNNNIKYFTHFLSRNADIDAWNYLSTASFMYKIHHRSEVAKKNPNSWYYFFLELYKNTSTSCPTFKEIYK